MRHFTISIILIFFKFYSFSLIFSNEPFNSPMYFATASDTEHFPWLENLIESIEKYNHGKIGKIAVFNLGLKQSEIKKLNNKQLVKVYDIENVNSEIKNKFIVRPNGRLARGWYSWKPVVLYQALKMFPYILYIDSGIEVVSPLDKIFNEIKLKGYYLFDCGHMILPMVTKQIRDLFKLDLPENKYILEQDGISAGIQGLSRDLLESYVVPVYNLASNIKNFEADGTAFWGFGGARHDQALFSIMARNLKLQTNKIFHNPRKIRIGDLKVYFGILKYFKLRKHKEKDIKRLEHAKKFKLL